VTNADARTACALGLILRHMSNYESEGESGLSQGESEAKIADASEFKSVVHLLLR